MVSIITGIGYAAAALVLLVVVFLAVVLWRRRQARRRVNRQYQREQRQVASPLVGTDIPNPLEGHTIPEIKGRVKQTVDTKERIAQELGDDAPHNYHTYDTSTLQRMLDDKRTSSVYGTTFSYD